MTISELFLQVERAIAQLEQANQDIEAMGEKISRAEQRLYYLQAQRYLLTTVSQLRKWIQLTEKRLSAIDESLGTLEQIANASSFGSQAASAKYQEISETRAGLQRDLNDAYALLERIDSALNGEGEQAKQVLRK